MLHRHIRKSQRRESNPQPQHYECRALPIEATLARSLVLCQNLILGMDLSYLLNTAGQASSGTLIFNIDKALGNSTNTLDYKIARKSSRVQAGIPRKGHASSNLST